MAALPLTEASPAQHALCNLLGMKIDSIKVFGNHSSPRTYEDLLMIRPPEYFAVCTLIDDHDDRNWTSGPLNLSLTDSLQVWQGHIELYLKEGY